jgi:hypothetical protein
MHREELLKLIDTWTLTQVIEYINDLKVRVHDTELLIKELQVIKRRKSKKQTPDNGVRGGM